MVAYGMSRINSSRINSSIIQGVEVKSSSTVSSLLSDSNHSSLIRIIFLSNIYFSLYIYISHTNYLSISLYLKIYPASFYLSFFLHTKTFIFIVFLSVYNAVKYRKVQWWPENSEIGRRLFKIQGAWDTAIGQCQQTRFTKLLI